MDESNIITNKNKYKCIECQNENEIKDGANENDVVECAFCGIEYEIIEKREDGNYLLEMMEEEK